MCLPRKFSTITTDQLARLINQMLITAGNLKKKAKEKHL